MSKKTLNHSFFGICAISLLLLFSQCSTKTKTDELVVIPVELQSDADIVAFIHDYSAVVRDFNQLSETIVKITEGKSVSSTEDLSNMQKLKMAKVAIKSISIGKRQDELQARYDELLLNLNSESKIAFLKTYEELDSKMGQIDFEKLGIDPEEAKAEYERSEAERIQQKRESDSIDELRNEAIAAQKADGTYIDYESENAAKSSKIPGWLGVVFPLLVLGIISFSIIKAFGKVRRRFKDISYTASSIGDKLEEVEAEMDEADPNYEQKRKEIEEMRNKFNQHFNSKK